MLVPGKALSTPARRRNKERTQEEEAMNMSRRNLLAGGGNSAIMAMVSTASSSFAQSAETEGSVHLRTSSVTLGSDAGRAMMDIFRKKMMTAGDRDYSA